LHGKGLRSDDFGQKPAKRGVCSQVRILKELVVATRKSKEINGIC
jgi:hypothetical protein